MTMNTMTKNRHSYLRLTKVTNSAGNNYRYGTIYITSAPLHGSQPCKKDGGSGNRTPVNLCTDHNNHTNRGYIIKESREGAEREIIQYELKKDDITTTKSKKNFGAEKKKLFPSDMGMVVTDFLAANFPNIMNYNFTAQAEEALDNIAEGDIEWQKMIGQFYSPFHENVEKH